MTGEISAVDGALRRGADAVASGRTALRGELTGLENRLMGIGSHWQGQGAAAFGSVMQRWREDARRIVDALTEFETILLASQASYTASDEAQRSVFGRLQSRLG